MQVTECFFARHLASLIYYTRGRGLHKKDGAMITTPVESRTSALTYWMPRMVTLTLSFSIRRQGHSPFWTPRSGPLGRANDQTVALILAGEISYPRSMEPLSKALIRDLLHPDAEKRLGCREHATMRDEEADAPSSTSPSTPTDGSTGPATPMSTGGSQASGWCEIRSHEFFEGMDWEALLRRELSAPLKPGPLGKGLVGNFSREYTRQRAQWGGDQPDFRDSSEREVLFKRELLGFDFVRHPQ